MASTLEIKVNTKKLQDAAKAFDVSKEKIESLTKELIKQIARISDVTPNAKKEIDDKVTKYSKLLREMKKRMDEEAKDLTRFAEEAVKAENKILKNVKNLNKNLTSLK